jgi:hypothetical protein
MEKKYIKMSDLVDKEFTVEKVWPFKWKMWDNVAKTMLTSDTYVKDHRKVYGVVTDMGTVDMSATNLGSMLEGTSKEGSANIIGKTFYLKSNGKTGIDIRYFINPVFKKEPVVENTDPTDYSAQDNEDLLASIPF